jgi:hypothetical protein
MITKGYFIKQQDKYGECLWKFKDKEKADVFYKMMSHKKANIVLKKSKGKK